MPFKTLQELKELKANDKALFQHCLDVCGDRLNFLKLVYGFDFSGFQRSIPETEQQLAEEFYSFYHCSEESARKAIAWLGEFIQRGLEREKHESQTPAQWNPNQFNLSQRIAFGIINRSGAMEDYKLGLLSRQQLQEFLHNFHPSRRDFYSSSAIPPEYFAEITRKHGKLAVLNSMDKSSREYADLRAKQEQLRIFLLGLTIEQRLWPAELKKHHQKMHSLALELYGRFEPALVDLCQHSFTLANPIYVEEARRLFFLSGEDAAAEYLSRMKFKQDKIATILDNFFRQFQTLTGQDSGVAVSVLEKRIEAELERSGIFYRRQVPYREIADTDRRYVMDFLVGNTIVEVIDEQDDFIHTEKYWIKMLDKHDIAEKAKKDFLLISKSLPYYQKLQEAVQESMTKAQAYDAGLLNSEKEAAELAIPGPCISSMSSKKASRNLHFIPSRFMIGYIKAENS